MSGLALLGLLPHGSSATNEVPLPTPTIRVFEGSSTLVSLPDASTFDAGSTIAGGSGTSYTITILNNGLAPLALTSSPAVKIVGTNANQFQLTQPSSTTISPGSTTTFGLTLAPTSVGAKSAQLKIASNDPNTPTYILNLSGSGTAAPVPEIEIRQSSILCYSGWSCGSIPTTQELTSSAPIEFTIKNIGSGPLNLGTISLSGAGAADYSVDQSATTGTVAPNGSTTFSVTFSPKSTGTKTSTITIPNNDSDEGSFTIYLYGYASAIPAPDIHVQKVTGSVDIAAGATSDFGNQVEQTMGSAVQFKIQNLGNATLSLTGISPDYVVLSGPDADQFEITVQPATGTISAYGDTTFSVRFKPTSLGTKTALLSIANNDADKNPFSFTIKGTGVPVPTPEINIKQGASSIASGSTFDGFANTRVGGYISIPFVIENTGTATLTVNDLFTLSGPDKNEFSSFSSYNVKSIAPGARGDFSVSFYPRAAGTKTATLTITSNDSDEGSYVINLSAVAYTPSAPCMEIANGILAANASTGTVSGAMAYYSKTISLMTDQSHPSLIYYVEQPHNLSLPPFPLFSSYWDAPTGGVPTVLWFSRDGLGQTNFSGLIPYGKNSGEYFTWLAGSIVPDYSDFSFLTFIDIASPVSFVATNGNYSLIRGCHAMLFEESLFIPLSGTSSTNGLSKVWGYRKKINVNLIFVAGTYDNPSLAGVQNAIDRMKAIYAQDSVKVDLQFTATTITAAEFQTITDLTDDTGLVTGSVAKLYETTGAAQDSQSLNIYLTSDNAQIAGVLGMSPGIPGVPGIIANKKSGMIVFLEMHRSSGSAGTQLSSTDQQFLGDTMAHEAGHFLGLFHTNERGGYNAASPYGLNAKDAVVDTPYCLSSRDINGDGIVDLSECQGTGFTDSGALNLMFWAGDGILSQIQLTGEQGWVLRNNPLAY